MPQSVAIGDWIVNFISKMSIRKPLAHRYKSHVPISALSVVQAIFQYFRLPTSNSYVSTGSGYLWEIFFFFLLALPQDPNIHQHSIKHMNVFKNTSTISE